MVGRDASVPVRLLIGEPAGQAHSPRSVRKSLLTE
jgi:hypothetical protein